MIMAIYRINQLLEMEEDAAEEIKRLREGLDRAEALLREANRHWVDANTTLEKQIFAWLNDYYKL
jgi:predicted  nucleic acid-binding Zn-ribbon protein